ncbi:DegT/DnrJ/EryC1/StrS family aminotransferase [bacterium]|nr:DegT/DnrJ/EryC1/StrS family aminotransferase [bacterium]
MILHSKPSFGESELIAVTNVVKTGCLANGPATNQLETNLAKRVGRPVVCVSSGTAALHMALMTLGIDQKEKVAIPTHCCPSVLYALQYMGAEPVLYDCGSLGMGSEPGLFENIGPDVKAVLIVHQYGMPDEAVIANYDKPLIEDCAAALGSFINNQPVGIFGESSIFSFYATKMIAGGECGAVATNKKSVEWIKEKRSPRGANDAQTHFPYSPSDLCAALALVQMERLDEFVETRTRLAAIYSTELESLVHIPQVSLKVRPSWHRYIISTHKSRDLVIEAANKSGICLGYGVKTPIHRLLKMDPLKFSASEHAWNYTVSLPIYPDLTELEQERIIQFLRKFLVA